jgi:hypothetical protein
MNIVSFIDELVKIGAAKVFVKNAEMVGAEAHHGMVGDSPMPDHTEVFPHDVRTRLPITATTTSFIVPGALGNVDEAKEPIDQERFNRSYREKRQ